MKKIITLLLPVLFLITACSKDQKVVRQLDGTWKVTDVKENGASVNASEYEGLKYSFEKCKVSKEACNGSVTQQGLTLAFTYKITDDGEKIVFTTTFFGATDTETADIIEHSNSKFVISGKDGNDIRETTMEKE